LNQFCMSCQSYLRLWKASTRHQTAMGLGFKQNEGGKKRSTSQLVNLPILLPTLYLSHLCNLKKSFKWRQQSISRRTSNTVQATVRTLNTKLQERKEEPFASENLRFADAVPVCLQPSSMCANNIPPQTQN
jgi:hypothetical protein